MRYSNMADAHTLRRASLGPAVLLQRHRAFAGAITRQSLRGFGAGSALQTGVSTAKMASTGSAVGSSVASAIGMGASAGSFVPVIGTAIGAILGLVLSGVFNHPDQEIGNFNQAVAMWQANRTSVLSIADKYLVLAGLFDLDIHTNIPIYKRYGRMGEQRFVTDMMNLIYNAAQSGQITANDTPLTVMSRIVQPWIDSWGYGPMSDPHADLINLILIGMIADYVTGEQARWTARSGDFPFASLPKFALPNLPLQPAPPATASVPVPAAGPVAPAPSFSTPLAPAGGYSQWSPMANAQIVTPAQLAQATQGAVTQAQLNAAVAAALAQGATPAQASQAGIQYAQSIAPYAPAAPVQAAVQQAVSSQTGPDMTLILGAGAVLALVLILKRKSA